VRGEDKVKHRGDSSRCSPFSRGRPFLYILFFNQRWRLLALVRTTSERVAGNVFRKKINKDGRAGLSSGRRIITRVATNFKYGESYESTLDTLELFPNRRSFVEPRRHFCILKIRRTSVRNNVNNS